MSSISRPTMIINYSKIFSTLRVYNMFLLFHIPCITRVDTRFNRRLIEKQARERNEEGIEVIEDQKIIPTYVVSFQVIPSWNTFKSSKRGRGGRGGRRIDGFSDLYGLLFGDRTRHSHVSSTRK